MREYRNAVMDNARWTGFEPRPDDIFVVTPSKCGTTWMQTIVANLLWPDGKFPGHIVNGISPWIEAKFMPAEAMHAMLKAQTHRRCVGRHIITQLRTVAIRSDVHSIPTSTRVVPSRQHAGSLR